MSAVSSHPLLILYVAVPAMKKVALLVMLLLAAFAAWEWLTFPDVAALRTGAPATTAFMELRKRELRRAGKDDTIEYRFVPYGRISPNFRRAVLVAEDNAFYEHEGVDVEGLKDALQKDWQKKQLSAGGSTITQQLAKNLYLSPSRNPWRKIKEFLIARALERELSKKRILELYLNVAELGERTYGAEAAARRYFGEPAAALSPSQAALLAGALPNPRLMNPASPNGRLRWRQRMILSRLRRWGYLFEKEVLTEKKPPEKPKEEPVPADTDLTPETETAVDMAAGATAAGATATETATTTTETTTTEPAPPADTAPPPESTTTTGS